MQKGINLLITLFVLLSTSCQEKREIVEYRHSKPKIPFNPERYSCYKTNGKVVVDGRIDEKTWELAPWTKEFGDIEGEHKTKPNYKTKVKMLWDDDYLYFAAELEEPHIWGKLKQRDTIIFYDNDFEIFIDPDGDTHWYYEFEINALNTIWDLILRKPYRDAEIVADNSWNIKGLISAVHINGTLNDPKDIDQSWIIEVAMPWSALKEYAAEKRRPKLNEYWRIGFSRVQWITEIINGEYVKSRDSITNKNLAEHNWTWSAQGTIAMHKPERWGFVLFTDHNSISDESKFEISIDEEIKWALRQLYYIQKRHKEVFNSYTENKEALHLNKIKCKSGKFIPTIKAGKENFEIKHKSFVDNKIWTIRTDGKIWKQ